MDTFSVLIGFLIGVVATMIAVEFGLKKIFRPPAMNKVTASWRLEDHQAPLVVAQDATSMPLPKGSRVVTSGNVTPAGHRDRVHRRNPNARSNFLIDPDMDRALVFMGPIKEGTLALATLDPTVAARLRAEHKRLWETGEPYVEELSFAQLGKNLGVLASVRGRVQECIAYREHHLLRLTDGTQTVGVVVEDRLDLDGKNVVVTGRVVRGASGYPILDAEEVRLQGGSPQDAPMKRSSAGSERDPVSAPSGPAQTPPEQEKGQILRVPRYGTSPKETEPFEEPVEQGPPDVDEEAQEPVTTEAERRRQKARVIMHR